MVKRKDETGDSASQTPGKRRKITKKNLPDMFRLWSGDTALTVSGEHVGFSVPTAENELDSVFLIDYVLGPDAKQAQNGQDATLHVTLQNVGTGLCLGLGEGSCSLSTTFHPLFASNSFEPCTFQLAKAGAADDSMVLRHGKHFVCASGETVTLQTKSGGHTHLDIRGVGRVLEERAWNALEEVEDEGGQDVQEPAQPKEVNVKADEGSECVVM